MADIIEDDSNIPSILLPCVSCNRTFRPEALAKHTKVCEKSLMKKRKKFDSSKQRIQGTELAEFLPILPTFTKKIEKSPVRKIQAQPSNVTLSSCSKTSLTSPKTKWREKHNELVQTIKAAKLPPGQAPITPIKPSDHEQCPYCERTFGPKAYDRHLEWCKEQRTRIQPKSPASRRAKERLEARTKYRAPLTNKGTQRSSSRDKFIREPSPSPQFTSRHHTPASVRKKPAVSAVLESISAPNINHNFVKGTPLRSSTRSVPSVKKTPQQARIARFPSPNSSLKLNPEEVNDQVPEMCVTGYETRELLPGLDIDMTSPCKSNGAIDCQMISTFEIDIPDDFLGTSTPHFVDDENLHIASSLDLSTLCSSNFDFTSASTEPFTPELNRTYTKEDLKHLVECSSLGNRFIENELETKCQDTRSIVKEKIVFNIGDTILQGVSKNINSLKTSNMCEKLNIYVNRLPPDEAKVSNAKQENSVMRTKLNNPHVKKERCHRRLSSRLNFCKKNKLSAFKKSSNDLPLMLMDNSDLKNKSFYQGFVKENMHFNPNWIFPVVEITIGFSFTNRFINDGVRMQLFFQRLNSTVVMSSLQTLQSQKQLDTSSFPVMLKNNKILSEHASSCDDNEVQNTFYNVFEFKGLMYEESESVGNIRRVESIDDCFYNKSSNKDRRFSVDIPDHPKYQTAYDINHSPAKKMKLTFSPRSCTSERTMLSEYDSGTYWDYYGTGKIERPKKIFPVVKYSSSDCSSEKSNNTNCFNLQFKRGSFILNEQRNSEQFINSKEKKCVFQSSKQDENESYSSDISDRSARLSSIACDSLNSSIADDDNVSISSINSCVRDNRIRYQHFEKYNYEDSCINEPVTLDIHDPNYCSQLGVLQSDYNLLFLSESATNTTQHRITDSFCGTLNCEKSAVCNNEVSSKELNYYHSKKCSKSTTYRTKVKDGIHYGLYKSATTLRMKPEKLMNLQSATVRECNNPNEHSNISINNKKCPSRLPQICKQLNSVTSSSNTTFILEKPFPNRKGCNNSCNPRTKIDELNLIPKNVFVHSDCSSKLPVLHKKTFQADKSNKTHWTEKYNQLKERQKLISKTSANSIESARSAALNKKSEMYQSLRAFTKAEINPNTIFTLNRNLKLSPIASISAISSSSQACSDSESLYGNSDRSLENCSEEFVNADYSESHLYQEDLKNICKRSYSDSVTLTYTSRGQEPPPKDLQSVQFPLLHHRYDCHLPLIAHCKEDKYTDCHKAAKNERMRFPNAVKKVVTQITKKRVAHGRELYDPYKSAERQMLELLEPDKELPKLAPISKSPALLSSPTSAFTKFSAIQSPEPLFISEDDNSNHTSKDENKSNHSSEKSDSPLTITSPFDNYSSSKDSNQNQISLSTLSLCSTISIESVESNINGYRLGFSSSAKVPEKKTTVPLRRTVSAFESRRGKGPLKGKLKMEDMLYGSSNTEGDRFFGSPLITGQLDNDNDNHSSSGSLYKSVSDAETLNAEQELLKSMCEFEKLISSPSPSSSPSSPPLKLFPSLVSSSQTEDPDKHHDMELHAIIQSGGPDSAYSSLNRKSPVGGEQEKDFSCFDSSAVARFCHECGTKYPVLAAKFCCQCGVRRLII